MLSATFKLWELIDVLPGRKWKCKLCGYEHAGGETRIMAHFARVDGCKVVDAQVRSEALKALGGARVVELTNRQGNFEEGLRQPVVDAAMPYLGSGAEEEEPDTVVPQGERPRATDTFLELVEVLSNGKRRCNLCGNEYVGGVERIKAHLAGGGGCEICRCKVFGKRVRSEALEGVKGERVVELSNRQGSNGGSSNLTDNSRQPLSTSGEDGQSETSFAAAPHLSYGAGSPACLPLPETNFLSQSLPASTNMPLPPSVEDGELNTEVPQGARTRVAVAESQPVSHTNMMPLKRKLQELISSAQADRLKMKREEHWSVARAVREGTSSPPLENVAEAEGPSKEVEGNLLAPRRFRQEAMAHVRCSKTSPLVTKEELVGKETRQKVNEILSHLMQHNVSIIGVYGMGGVGKTAILRHVYNRLLPLPLDVFWVAVPQDFSVYGLQEEIASAVGLDNLSEEKDVKRRAGLLYGHLNVKNRPILILDGLWMHFEAKDVGIPVGTGKLKVVVTTRSLDVCRMMPCQKQIKIELLDMEDSWRLFSKTLCFAGELPQGVEQIARSLLDRCYGLPLGIIEIATRMRGVEKAHEWRGMLGNLEDSWVGLDVLKRLQLSYLNLGDDEARRCFLHLILRFGELSEASREDLIETFIDEGLLGEIATRQGLYDRGHAVLDKIEGAGLLDPEKWHQYRYGKWHRYQYVHPMTRDMALNIVPSTTHMVKAYLGLKEIPEEVFWTDRLEKVFLQCNEIEEIPYGISPNCPKLTRLSLNGNNELQVIHESFFRHLQGLRVLDLSGTEITELPDSISQLESLEALLLECCLSLRFIPYVGKLRSLRKLNLQGCQSLDEVPEGMEMLVNLRYLALDGTEIKTLPEGVLGKLVNLQYLAIKRLRAGEEVNLPKVEVLYSSVSNVKTFNACVGSLERNSCRRYRLAMGTPNEFRLWRVEENERSILLERCDHIAARAGGASGDGCALLPESMQSLELSGCHRMKRAMEWEWLTALLPDLRDIAIDSCEKLEEMIHGPLPSGATCRLTCIKVNGCSNMKRVLLTQGMLLNLPFLKKISVKDCKGIEVIIGTVSKMTHCSLPKLTNLELHNLPELKSVCDGTASCDSLRSISIDNCPKLKRIPLQLPLLDNGLPSPPPSLREIWINRQTWVLLEWDHPLARSSLEHLVKYLGQVSRCSNPWR